MNRNFKAIMELRNNFVSANKDVFKDEKLANKHDFETNISLTAYHNWILSDAVELFYDIQVQNINNLIDEIVITAAQHPSHENRVTAGNAEAIQEQILASIDEDFGRFNAMSTQQRYALASNLAVTFISPTVLERSRKDILDNTMAKDNTYKSDILKDVRNETCEHFIDYVKSLNDDFKKKYGPLLANLSLLKEILPTSEQQTENNTNNQESPSVKANNRTKIHHG